MPGHFCIYLSLFYTYIFPSRTYLIRSFTSFLHSSLFLSLYYLILSHCRSCTIVNRGGCCLTSAPSSAVPPLAPDIYGIIVAVTVNIPWARSRLYRYTHTHTTHKYKYIIIYILMQKCFGFFYTIHAFAHHTFASLASLNSYFVCMCWDNHLTLITLGV